MTLKLYYVPRTRSSRTRWLMEELGVPYELVRLDPKKGENKTAEYLSINPLGHVPSLVDGDFKLFESSAICLYLAERFPEKKLLAPSGTAERARSYQWLFFAMTELEGSLHLIGTQTHLPVEQRNAKLLEDATKKLQSGVQLLEAELADKPYLMGADFTVADVVMGGVLNWARMLGQLEGLAKVGEYVERLKSRPAFKRATAD
jgi:glutathione S-transferase